MLTFELRRMCFGVPMFSTARNGVTIRLLAFDSSSLKGERGVDVVLMIAHVML